jgi:hypothetical protein
MSKADDRIRQAEQDAARAREIAEEHESRRDRTGSENLVGMRTFAERQQGMMARVIRDYVRAVMIEPVVRRLYDVGMGVETFEVPTEAGNVVEVPASPGVQVDALKALIQIGIPHQLGLIDDDGNTLPGAIILGELDMRSAQETVHGARMAGIARSLGGEPGAHASSPPLPPMADRIAAGEFEVVEVEEGVGQDRQHAEDQPPAPLTEGPMTPEQRILAKRRARRAQANGG